MTTTITAPQLQQRLREDPSLQLIDVRNGAEFESAHIPGSVNVPLDALNRVGHEIAKTDSQYVLVCQSGQRANQAHNHLTTAGKDDLIILDGGIAAWEEASGDLAHGTERWAMDRQVRGVAGVLVLTGVVASSVLPAGVLLAGFVGAGLTYSAASNTCAMAAGLAKLPYNKVDGPDVEDVVAGLVGS